MDAFATKLMKRSWRLLPWSALHPVVEAMMVGAAKYGVDNWQQVPTCVFEDALLRHVTAHLSGALYDHEETGLPHLALAAANALILVAKIQRELHGPTYEASVARTNVSREVLEIIEAHRAKRAAEEASGRPP